MATFQSLVVFVVVAKKLACCFTGKVFPLPSPPLGRSAAGSYWARR